VILALAFVHVIAAFALLGALLGWFSVYRRGDRPKVSTLINLIALVAIEWLTARVLYVLAREGVAISPFG
jgi:hypothetical protein